MTSTLALMSYGAKLSLLNMMITSVTIFALWTLKFPPKILELLDKIRRKCLFGQKRLSTGINVTHWLLGTWFINQNKVVDFA